MVYNLLLTFARIEYVHIRCVEIISNLFRRNQTYYDQYRAFFVSVVRIYDTCTLRKIVDIILILEEYCLVVSHPLGGTDTTYNETALYFAVLLSFVNNFGWVHVLLSQVLSCTN